MERLTFTLLLCAAASGCVDHSVAGSSDPAIMGDVRDGDGGGGGPVAAPLTITSCGTTTIDTPNLATSLAIAPSGRGGALMFGTRRGQLLGYRFDAGELTSDPAGSPIATDAKVTSTAATTLGGRTVVASVGDGQVVLDLVNPDLKDVAHLATFSGTGVSEQPMVTAPDGYLLPLLDSDGIHLDRFDRTWRMTSETVITTALPPQGISAALVGNNSLVAWSTSNECHLQYADAQLEGDGSWIGQGCTSPHLAVNPTTGEALLAYESADGVMINNAPFGRLDTTPVLVQRHTKTPQVAFDGTRFWLAFTDDRDQLVVGFYDGKVLTSTMLLGMTPEHGNYRLQILDGQVAIVSTSATGYSVQRMCTRSL